MEARTLQLVRTLSVSNLRKFSSSVGSEPKYYKVVVAGGGTGGTAVAARACRAFGPGKVAVIEPAETHYYQPLWTLVGAGIKKFSQTARPMSQVLPKTCDHHKTGVQEFQPEKNTIKLTNGQSLCYDYLVISLGIQTNLNNVGGLIEALKADPSVCSIYVPETVEKTYSAIQNFKGGQAIFTFPNTPIKCAGAPQKITYLAEEYWRNHGVRDKTEINYYTSLPKMFGVEKYAASLAKVAARKEIHVNFRTTLTAVDHTKKTATIKYLDDPNGKTETRNYDFLHVAPPMSAPGVLKNSTSPIVDESGFLNVNKNTMQHNTFPNIFGLGDCTNLPTSKTAAAIGAQNKILFNSLQQVIAGKIPDGQYDGYTACPLVTGYHHCILAEFDYSCQPLETFPFDQGKERRTMYYMKRDLFPQIYWRLLMKGNWSGQKHFRKILHLGMSK